ncbi:hypothetical protein [Methylocystis bryophila]|uniref:Uncharacterized protein n=1 Tax=Methylocystis bryophila TaxID=655015 RepID=A0A1W6MZW9_9HYPH|nr:hypothetical protein [Methylocystis bryophila]ARN83103.1 hypothetical protein B1812_20735 [Methylocystis bryophila]BDV39423.1 hypothetical protein DSM21852_26760 [Methylocystis bryophila]
MQIDFQAHCEDALKVSVTIKSREEFERFTDQLFVVAEVLWPSPYDEVDEEEDQAERPEPGNEAQPRPKTRGALTPEELRARKDRRNAQNRSYIAQMTPEERAEFRRRRTAQERARRENARRVAEEISRASTEQELTDYSRAAAAE